MTFLWVWAYALKFPLSVVCGLALTICFLTFASGLKSLNSRTGDDGRSRMLMGLNIGIFFAILWAGVYALPSPTYNVVYKDRPVPYPVVRKVVAVRQVVTITRNPTLNDNVTWCLNNPNVRKDLDDCTTWAKNMMQPRVVIKQVPVKVFGGYKMVYPTRDQRVQWCIDNPHLSLDANQCTDWAIKMELPPQVRVVLQHDKFMDIYKWCNETYSLDGVPNSGELRNQRLQICADVALKGSR